MLLAMATTDVAPAATDRDVSEFLHVDMYE